MPEATPEGVPTGGRVRQYASDADRARAWRERQKSQRTTPAPAATPELAIAGLQLTLERLEVLVREHRDALGGEVARVQEAISVLADPAAVSDTLEAGRAEAARQVAEAHEQLARERQARTSAEHAARQADEDRSEAEAAARTAWERVEALEADLEVTRADLARTKLEATEAATAHEESLERLRTQATEELARATASAEKAAAEAEAAAGAALAEAQAATARAEGVATEARTELAARQAAHDQAVAALQAEHGRALERQRDEVTETLSARQAAESGELRARLEGEVARAQARAEGAAQLAEARSGEVERLVTQVEDLRGELARQRELFPERTTTKTPRRTGN